MCISVEPRMNFGLLRMSMRPVAACAHLRIQSLFVTPDYNLKMLSTVTGYSPYASTPTQESKQSQRCHHFYHRHCLFSPMSFFNRVTYFDHPSIISVTKISRHSIECARESRDTHNSNSSAATNATFPGAWFGSFSANPGPQRYRPQDDIRIRRIPHIPIGQAPPGRRNR